MKLKNKTVVGAYENLLDYESQYYYRALNLVEGYGLRKQCLKPLRDNHADLYALMCRYSVYFYYHIVRVPMLAFKKEILIEVSKRQDMEQML